MADQRQVTYRFENIKDQRDMFVLMMDMIHYGMYDDSLEIGPFNSNAFVGGIWVRGDLLDVDEFTKDFETKLGKKKYKASVTDIK
jgi:hypothetical protein